MKNLTESDEIGWGYKKVERGQRIKCLDQYYSYIVCRWKATTVKYNEDYTVQYIPTRRPTNILTLGISIYKKVFGK